MKAVDDRYVIANAGDELALRFPAPPPPPEGWVRDFVLIGDGWNKDGDYNTAFSKTVLPLPSHAAGLRHPPGRARTTRCIASIRRIGGSISVIRHARRFQNGLRPRGPPRGLSDFMKQLTMVASSGTTSAVFFF